MNVKTKYFGEIAIDKEDVLLFSSGLPGFQQETEFIILDIEGNELLQVLQSVKTEKLAFIITNPHVFYEDYEFKLDDYTIDSLEIKAKEDLVIYSILTLKEPFNTSTINLKAPLIINFRQRLAKQYILKTDSYPLKASIPTANISDEKGV